MDQNTARRNKYVYGKLFLTKEPKNFKGKGSTFQQMVVEEVAIHMKRKEIPTGIPILYHAPKLILDGRKIWK